MSDIWVVLGGLAAVGGVVATTVTSLRASSAKRHVERAHGAAELLRDLDALPRTEAVGTRFRTETDETELRQELSRIFRENAAAYSQQYPTLGSSDLFRLMVPLYSVLLFVFSIAAFVAAAGAATSVDQVGSHVSGLIFLAGAVLLASLALVLGQRMSNRNTARKLAGTPGQEKYWSTIPEMIALVRNRRAKARAQRANRRAPE